MFVFTISSISTFLKIFSIYTIPTSKRVMLITPIIPMFKNIRINNKLFIDFFLVTTVNFYEFSLISIIKMRFKYLF